VSRPLSATARREGERLVCAVRLSQPDFGIRPYKAFLGALKVQAEVRVELSLPAGALTAG
jgi:hypothetical protein